jgi:serine/threonine protein kinase
VDARDLIARLLIVNPQARFTVEDALQHKWLQQPEEVLAERQLTRGLTALRLFQAKRKFRAGLKAVHLVARVQTLLTFRTHPDMAMDIANQGSVSSMGGSSGRTMSVVHYDGDFEMDVEDDPNHLPVPPPAGTVDQVMATAVVPPLVDAVIPPVPPPVVQSLKI